MDDIRRLADAVLYEGYILWPYRRSSVKNMKRWTFGGVFPPAHSAEHPDDRALVETQVLVEGDADVEVAARFLQVVERQVVRHGTPVDEASVGGERYLSWDEAVEREVAVRCPGEARIAVAGGSKTEALGEGVEIVRTWRALAGTLSVAGEALGDGLTRVTARLANETPWDGSDREDALRQAFCSAHVVLRADGGAFVSATDPPPEHAGAASGCVNTGLWPVLVGPEGDRGTMLAAPIILSDHPQIAPESPGDLFDATEIDRLLILNVLSMSEAEQAEMRAGDPRAREILERCAGLGPEELLPLHGVMRDPWTEAPR